MGQRNMMCPNQMIDFDMDQQAQSHLHPEPCLPFGSVANYPQPNIHMVLPASGNTSNFDVHQLPKSHENVFHGMPHYNGFQHQYPAGNLDIGVAAASNYYNPYMNPSGSLVFPPPINYGAHDQLPSSSSGGIVGVPTDDYRKNNHFMDGVRGSFKRKNAEAIPRSFQHNNASAGPSSARTRSGAIGPDNVLAHNANHLIQTSYQGQAFQTAGTPWLDQRFSNNGGDGGTWTWSPTPVISQLHGSSVHGGCREAGNMGAQGYQETASNRSSTTFLHLPPIYQGHPNLHHLPQPMQVMRGQDNLFSQAATSSRRVSANSTSQTSMNPFQDSIEVGPRYAGPVPPTGLRIYRPRQRTPMHEAIVRHRDLPHLRVLSADEVAMLEISGYYEVGNFIDHHRDMRLDIDHMSYEELLALGEQIGSVTTGVSEGTISSHLKIRTYTSSRTSMNMKEAACVDQETDFCVICQNDYEKQEKIGTLDCGHEYHVDCLKRWLIVKNTCPICKSTALTTKRKDLSNSHH